MTPEKSQIVALNSLYSLNRFMADGSAPHGGLKYLTDLDNGQRGLVCEFIRRDANAGSYGFDKGDHNE